MNINRKPLRCNKEYLNIGRMDPVPFTLRKGGNMILRSHEVFFADGACRQQ